MRKDIILARYGSFFEKFTKENSFYYNTGSINVWEHFSKWLKEQGKFPCSYVTFRIIYVDYRQNIQKEFPAKNSVLFSKYWEEKKIEQLVENNEPEIKKKTFFQIAKNKIDNFLNIKFTFKE